MTMILPPAACRLLGPPRLLRLTSATHVLAATIGVISISERALPRLCGTSELFSSLLRILLRIHSLLQLLRRLLIGIARICGSVRHFR